MEEMDCNTVVCGANACVFDDDLKYDCEFNRKENKNYKIKIIDKEMGGSEIENMKKIDELMMDKNKDNQYYIGNPIVCKNNVILKGKCENCMTIKGKNCNHMMAINYEDGGISLDKFLKKNKDYGKLLDGFLNLFEAVNILNQNTIYHSDIKPQNIVVNDQYQCRLIDMGDSRIYKDIDAIKIFAPGGTPPLFPPEKMPYWGMYGERTNILTDILTFDKDTHDWILKIGTKTEIENQSYYGGLTPLEKKIGISKCDVWALGVTLYYIYDTMKKDTLAYMLLDVISELLVLDVENRPSAYEALEIYRKFLNKKLHSRSKSPHGRSKSPHSRIKSPRSRIKSPHGRSKSPHGRSTSYGGTRKVKGRKTYKRRKTYKGRKTYKRPKGHY